MGGVALIAAFALFFGYVHLVEFMCRLEPPEKGPPKFGFWRAALLMVILALAEIGLIRVFLWIENWLGS